MVRSKESNKRKLTVSKLWYEPVNSCLSRVDCLYLFIMKLCSNLGDAISDEFIFVARSFIWITRCDEMRNEAQTRIMTNEG